MTFLIGEQVDTYTDTEIGQLFSIKDSSNNVIISGDAVTDYLKYMYGDYKVMRLLHVAWGYYNAMHKDDFLRAYTAWTASYEPLDNYNGKETNIYLTNDGDLTSTTTHGKGITTTANSVANVNEVTTFDDTNYRPEGKTTQTGNTVQQDSGTTSVKDIHSTTTLSVDGTSYTADKVSAEIKDRHGNLGVTSSQQMILSEVNMRLYPLVQLYIDEFISEYAYLVE